MSSKVRSQIHLNSLLAYFEGKESFFSRRELAVLKAVERLGRASDREVMIALGFSDMNAVRPRITELIDEGMIEEIADQEDPVTRKTVRVLSIARDPRKAQKEFEFALEANA